MPRCPGQDQRYWTPDDIFDVKCPHCGNAIEFWKDEPMRICSDCLKEVRNPRIDLGCAKWCKHAAECLGKMPGALPAIPLIENIKAKLSKIPGVDADVLGKAEQLSCAAERGVMNTAGEVVVAKAAALIVSVLKSRNTALLDGFFDDIEMDKKLAIKIYHTILEVLSGQDTDHIETKIVLDIISNV